VHLADRRRGERLLVEVRVGALERLAQLALDGVADEREVHRRRLALQLLERRLVLGRDAALDEGHHLAELHERALHLAHRLGDALGVSLAARLVDALAPRLRREHPAQRGAQPARRHAGGEAADRRQARETPRGQTTVAAQPEQREGAHDGDHGQGDEDDGRGLHLLCRLQKSAIGVA
jgi:hypothetical protein